jgi:ABC-type uncharacterized transport system auxiliary subunit
MKQIAAVAALVLLVLGGCGGLERNAPEPRVYVLTAAAIAPGPAAPADLLVLRPVVVPALATGRIATRWPGNRIDYYAGARWSGELAQNVQAAVVEAVRRSGRIRTVQPDPGRFSASHVLGVEVDRLEADYSGGGLPVAKVTLVATVGRFQERQPLGTWAASYEHAAAANTLTDVTAALDAAFRDAVRDVVTPALDAVAADAARKP